MKIKRWHIVILACILVGLATWAATYAVMHNAICRECQSFEDTVTNKDGSDIKLSIMYKLNGQRYAELYYSPPSNDEFHRLNYQLVKVFDEPQSKFKPAAWGYIDDWDRNGVFEIHQYLDCGVKPSCLKVMYHITPEGKLMKLFTTRSSHIRYFHGHLIAYTRVNCCSWSLEAYPVSEDRLKIASEAAFHVSVRPDDEAEPRTNKNICEFTQASGPGPGATFEITEPPDEVFRELCDVIY